ncbi:MAG: peptidase MA family metallohydrolase [Peptococcaceae bacterium]|nr:peptidase MA family metallohydrolase [Peptococcaceae bacterium]MDH7523772.1 peptidase MA family metallohydrolase [Peptococcaceae bacterium]
MCRDNMYSRLLTKAILLAVIAAVTANMLFGAKPFAVHSYGNKLIQRIAWFYLDYQTKNYYELQSEHFLLKYSAADKSAAHLTAEKAEEYLNSAKRILLDDSEEGRILLVLYPDRDSLNGSFGWGSDKSAAGVYWAGSIVLLSPRAWKSGKTSEEEMKNILAHQVPLSHELTHLLVDRQTGGNYCRWLTEGLAQYVEEKIAGFRLKEPLPEERENLYPLDGLEKNFDRQENQELAYWQSLQTVKFLLDEHGMVKMQELLAVLGKGARIEEALNSVYGLDRVKLENAVKGYLAKQDYD